jgi:hypothetical protein
MPIIDLKSGIGIRGATGQQGTTGVGSQGVTGAAGAVGNQGVTGVAGAVGNQGVTGAAGAVGNQGVTGAAGPSGNQGVTGAAGTVGNQGVTGAAGPSGNQGVTGAAGPSGNQGVTGAAGPSGNQGVTGAQGQTGAGGTKIYAWLITSPAVATLGHIRVPVASTVTRVDSSTDTGTVTFNVEERSTLNSAGTNVLSSDQVAGSTGAYATGINNSDLAAGNYLAVDISAVASSPTQATITLTVTVP